MLRIKLLNESFVKVKSYMYNVNNVVKDINVGVLSNSKRQLAPWRNSPGDISGPDDD